MVRRWFYAISALTVVSITAAGTVWPAVLWSLAVVGPLIAVGLVDCIQREHTIRRNFPLVGHFRYLFESVRPEIQQYFIESNVDAYPIEREFRSLVYQRAKGELETRPFGTHRDVYGIGYEWAAHTVSPRDILEEPPRIQIGGNACTRPYSASLLNISAMSFGSLSARAIEALSAGAARGNFAHNTGEGGVSPYHVNGGGALVWQIGTGYFGCRNASGRFDSELFREQASIEQVKMIELKLSQGAKPGHGGVLPGRKVTPEIAAIRKVTAGQTVLSPPGHREFDSPIGLLEFIQQLRELSGGKPVGFKLCIGKRDEFFSITKAMLETDIFPDFITVDGGEGGTGAAPLEFTNSIGSPARDGWVFAHGTLVGAAVRDRVKMIASGKILTGFHMVRALALGADICNSARGMMLALGCIQALRCNSDMCPTGVATQNRALQNGLDVKDKSERVYRFHQATVYAALELLSAMGLDHTDELRPNHIYRRIGDSVVRHMGDLYEFPEKGQLLDGNSLPDWAGDWNSSRADRWKVILT